MICSSSGRVRTHGWVAPSIAAGESRTHAELRRVAASIVAGEKTDTLRQSLRMSIYDLIGMAGFLGIVVIRAASPRQAEAGKGCLSFDHFGEHCTCVDFNLVYF